MNLPQRLFNSSPVPNAIPITDKQGQRYWQDWDDSGPTPNIFLWHRGKCIAHVYLQCGTLDLVLVDIVIDEPRFRNRGLGTSLLQTIIHWAKKQGIRSIKGLVAKHDIEANNKLLDWYHQNGFQIDLLQDDHWVARISLEIGRGVNTGEMGRQAKELGMIDEFGG